MLVIQRRACYVALAFGLLGGCTLSPQARHDKYLARGKALMQKHEYSRAILEFRNAAKAMPNGAEAYYQIGLASQDKGDIRGAVAFYRKALSENPKHTGAQLKLAELKALTLDKGMIQEGETSLKNLKQESPASSEVLNSLAFAELRLGKTQDAIANLDEVLDHAPRALNASILLAETNLRQGDAKSAEAVLKKACAAAPKSASPHVALGDLYVVVKRPDDARAEFQRALAIDPKSGPALMDLANLQRSIGQKQQAEQSFKRLAHLGDTRYRLVYADFLFEDGRRAEAIREFERVLKENPGDRQARTQLVAAYREVGRTADAERVLDEALKKNPKDLDALLQRSELFLTAGKYTQSQSDLNEVLVLHPNSSKAHYILAKLYQTRGEPLTYRQELSKALTLNPYSDPIRVELAQSFIRDKQGQAALDTLNGAPASQKQSMPILVERNWALWATGDMAQMRKGIEEGLSRDRLPELLIQDGLWKLKDGNPSGARASLEDALKTRPADVRALAGLAQSYIAQKKTAQAIQAVEEYASREPKSAGVQEFLGTLLMLSGDREKARAAFTEAQSADPKSLDADFSLVQLDLAEGKAGDARDMLDSILAKQPAKQTASLWLGNVDLMQGKKDAAVRQFKQVVNADPNNAQALNNLAYLMVSSGNASDQALKYAQKAVGLAPDDPSYLDTLGWILYEKGLYATAVQYLARAVSDRGSVVSRYHLAMAYAKAGDAARGRTELAAALKANPKLPEAKLAAAIVAKPN